MNKFRVVILGPESNGHETAKLLFAMFSYNNSLENTSHQTLDTCYTPFDICLITEKASNMIPSDMITESSKNDSTTIRTSNDQNDLINADVIIFALGMPTGKSNLNDKSSNLLFNLCIIKYIKHIKNYAKSALIIVIGDSVEHLTFKTQIITGFSSKQVIGLELDSDKCLLTLQLTKELLSSGYQTTSNTVNTLVIENLLLTTISEKLEYFYSNYGKAS